MERHLADTRPWRRLRWRMRGAWQWPTFAVALIVDAVLLHVLPISGDGAHPVGALLSAGFLNLGVIAVLAPLAGRRLRRRRPDLPRVVANDYAGTVLIVCLMVILGALGLMHRPSVQAGERAFRAQSEAVRLYVLHQAPALYRRNLDRADSLHLGENLYRTCVPGSDIRHALCLFVDTSLSPPGLRRDPNPAPNLSDFGPGGVNRFPG